MNRHFRPVYATWFLVAVAPLMVGGCAKLKVAPPLPQDVAPEREERKQQVVEDFERRRDESQYHAALAAWERGDTHNCEDQLVQLLRRTPRHRQARQALADLYLEGQNLSDAEKHYRQLVADHPQDAPAHHCLGLLLELLGRQEEARQELAQASRLEPSNPLFTAHTGSEGPVVQASVDLPDPSAAAANSGDTSSPMLVAPQNTRDPDDALRRAAHLLQSGQPDAALRLADVAAKRHPGHLGLKRVLATAQLELGRLEAAQVTLGQALSLDKADALTYFLLGCTLAEQGDSAVAQRHFATAHKLDPRLPAHR